MKKCSVRPYTGEQGYIYVAYAWKDKRYGYPILEQLVKDGYRIWFDEGITSGEEDPGEIAAKIAGCQLFLAFLSENAAQSCSFKREVNFAIHQKKEIIAVMLQETHLSPGMELQLSAFPAIYKYKVEPAVFYKRLYAFDVLKPCLGTPDDSVVVSDEDEYNETLVDLYGVDERVRPPLGEELFLQRQTCTAGTEMPNAVLTKLTTKEEIPVLTPKMVIGRGGKPVVDYSIHNNSMVSRVHAVILHQNQEYYLVDCGAVNKTFVNSTELKANEEYLLHDGDIVKFANEKFRFRRVEV